MRLRGEARMLADGAWCGILPVPTLLMAVLLKGRLR